MRTVSTIGIYWAAGADDGSSPILDYRISFAIQGGAFGILATVTDTSYLVMSLNAGTIYEFKVEARNQYDYSEYSTVFSVLCATIPEIPTDVITEIIGS